MNAGKQVRRGHNIPAIGPFVLRTGWAAPYQDAPNGQRQLFGIMLPGERSATRDGTAITALTDCTIEPFDREAAIVGGDEPPLTWFDAYDEVLKWLFVLGHGNGVARVAFLIRNLEQRLRSLPFCSEHSFCLEISQIAIAEFCCLSTVHVNRAIRYLDRAGVLQRNGRIVAITNPSALRALAELRVVGEVHEPHVPPRLNR